jgi:hypothetical protein
MKKVHLIIYITVCMMTFSSCDHFTKGFNTYFWTSSNRGHHYHLYIDSKDRGPLPYLEHAPLCNDATTRSRTLYLPLPSGRYDIEVRDESGNVKYDEKLFIKRTVSGTTISATTNWKGSGARASCNDDCLIREIFLYE